MSKEMTVEQMKKEYPQMVRCAEEFAAGLSRRTKPHMLGDNYYKENEGVKRCDCEDAPCCGH